MVSEDNKKRILEGAKRSGALRKRQSVEWERAYNANPTLCAYCTAPLPYLKRTNKFCSRSCAASMNNARRDKKSKPCTNCEILTKNSKFCSNECSHAYREKELEERVLLTGVFPLPPSGSTVSARKFLKNNRGTKCEICGLERWQEHEIPLVLDHTNGNPEDHRLANLRLICGNCNMLLPTFAGRNRGKGRKKRRETYKRLGYC